MSEQKNYLDDYFKFRVGDFIQVRAPSEHVDIDTFGERNTVQVVGQPAQVIERLLQECPGGVQKHYRCRMHSIEGDPRAVVRNTGRLHAGILRDTIQFNEIEVEAFDPGLYGSSEDDAAST